MKRSLINGFIILSVLIWATFGMALFTFGPVSSPVTRILASASVTALVHAENGYSYFTPGQNPNQCVIVRENGGPSFNLNLIGKQLLSVWVNTAIPKKMTRSGFFFAAMVLLLFIRFYQSSRTSSEEDPEFSLELRI